MFVLQFVYDDEQPQLSVMPYVIPVHVTLGTTLLDILFSSDAAFVLHLRHCIVSSVTCVVSWRHLLVNFSLVVFRNVKYRREISLSVK